MPDKLMPDPWFVSTSSPRGIGDALHREPYRMADEAKGERMVGPFVLPSFQRGKAWTVEQQVALVESLWEGLPIGGYVYNDDQSFGGDAPCPLAYLLDGQQRWTAIFDYVADAFPVKGHLYSELGQRERFRFQMKEFTMLRCNLKTEVECRHVYERLAYGGTPHLSLDKDYVVEGRSYRLVEAEPEYEGGAPSV